MLEIKPFTPTDLDVITEMAREQDFAPGVGDIEIYANTDRLGIWLAEDPVMASLLLNNAIERIKGIVLIDTPGYNPAAKTITVVGATAANIRVPPQVRSPCAAAFADESEQVAIIQKSTLFAW